MRHTTHAVALAAGKARMAALTFEQRQALSRLANAGRARKRLPVLERILQRVEKLPDAPGCWLWTGRVNYAGYGLVKIGGKGLGVHRAVFELVRGPIPPTLVLDHLCRVRCCCRPDHLEPVTHRTNILRGEGLAAANAQKERCPKGHPLDWVLPAYGRPGRHQRRCRKCNYASFRRWKLKQRGRT